MAELSLCHTATPSPGATPRSSSRCARLVAARSNSHQVSPWSAPSPEKSTYAGLSGDEPALRRTHSDRVVSDHQPAARYRAASALVKAAPSTPITKSYEDRLKASPKVSRSARLLLVPVSAAHPGATTTRTTPT